MNFAKSYEIVEINTKKGQNRESRISLLQGTKRLLRWFNEDLNLALVDAGLDFEQIIKMHPCITTIDGNLYGHSKNIFKPTLDFSLPNDFCFSALVHDLAEVLYLEKGVHYDKPTGAKDASGYEEEAKYLQKILNVFGMDSRSIDSTLKIMEKSLDSQFGPVLKEIENLKFFEMRIYFEKLLENGGALLREKINKYLKEEDIAVEHEEYIFQAYFKYLQEVTKDIRSKKFHQLIQDKSSEFEMLLIGSVDITVALIKA